jgi:hypothetical protein
MTAERTPGPVGTAATERVKKPRRTPGSAGAAVAAAAEWRLLGLLLERPRGGWHEELARLGREVGDVALRKAAAAASGAGEGEYLGLLGPGGAVSPREVSYRGLEDPGRVLAELAAAYQAFAFRPRAEDPIDHVAVETAFVGYLYLKEGFARATGDTEAAETTAAARTAFVSEHLSMMAAPLAARLAAAGPSSPARAAALIAARLPTREAPATPPDLSDGCGTCPVA